MTLSYLALRGPLPVEVHRLLIAPSCAAQLSTKQQLNFSKMRPELTEKLRGRLLKKNLFQLKKLQFLSTGEGLLFVTSGKHSFRQRFLFYRFPDNRTKSIRTTPLGQMQCGNGARNQGGMRVRKSTPFASWQRPNQTRSRLRQRLWRSGEGMVLNL